MVAVVTAYLDQESADVVESLGGGTVGIRRAIAELLMYRNGAGGQGSRITTQAVTAPLQSIAKPRRVLNAPTQQEDLPVDPRAVYD